MITFTEGKVAAVTYILLDLVLQDFNVFLQFFSWQRMGTHRKFSRVEESAPSNCLCLWVPMWQ